MFVWGLLNWNSILMQSESLTKLELQKEEHEKFWQRFSWLTWRSPEQVRQKEAQVKCYEAAFWRPSATGPCTARHPVATGD
jgi:hypothetical protein